MQILRNKAFEIVEQNNLIKQLQGEMLAQHFTESEIERQPAVTQAREKMHILRCSIINVYQVKIFNEIRYLLEGEWRKQQYEATDMWREQ